MAQNLNDFIINKMRTHKITCDLELSKRTGIPLARLQYLLIKNMRIEDRYLSKIAFLFGLSLGKIKRLHVTSDDVLVVDLDGGHGGRHNRKKRVTLEPFDDVIHKLIGEGKNFSDIAAIIGASENGVLTHVRRATYVKRYGYEKPKTIYNKRNKVLELLRQGKNPYAISKLIDVSYKYAYSVAQDEKEKMEDAQYLINKL